MAAETKDRLRELRIDREDRPRSRGGSVSIIVAIILTLTVVGLWWSLQRKNTIYVETAHAEPAIAVSAATVLDASGYVTARRRATVSSKITGKIVEVLVEEGLAVAQNQILAKIDNSLAARQLDLAQAQLAAARGSLAETEVRLREAQRDRQRTLELVESSVASAAELDSATATVEALAARLDVGAKNIEVAKRVVELRSQELEDTVIRAPFAGVVVTKDAQPGEMISPVSAGGGFTRTGICTLVDMGSLEIEVDVNEAFINRVEPNQPVTATLDAYPDWKIPSRVITTIPTADRQKATVEVRIAFDELDPRILPEMGVKVSFLDRAEDAENQQREPSARSAVKIPRRALHDGDTVFVLEAGTTVRLQAISIAESTGSTALRSTMLEVTEGLRAGDEVIIESTEPLEDGDSVTREKREGDT